MIKVVVTYVATYAGLASLAANMAIHAGDASSHRISGSRMPASITWKTVIASSSILSLALVGDALIYAVLPVHAETFGISLIWVGVLLTVTSAELLHGVLGAVVTAGMPAWARDQRKRMRGA